MIDKTKIKYLKYDIAYTTIGIFLIFIALSLHKINIIYAWMIIICGIAIVLFTIIKPLEGR